MLIISASIIGPNGIMAIKLNTLNVYSDYSISECESVFLIGEEFVL